MENNIDDQVREDLILADMTVDTPTEEDGFETIEMVLYALKSDEIDVTFKDLNIVVLPEAHVSDNFETEVIDAISKMTDPIEANNILESDYFDTVELLEQMVHTHDIILSERITLNISPISSSILLEAYLKSIIDA